MVEQLEEESTSTLSDTEQKDFIIALAHTEDFSLWQRAIADCFTGTSARCLPLIELVEQIQSSSTLESDRKVLLVKTWLAVLSGDFELVQREDFYSQTGVWVSLRALTVS